jgi:GNAT superfamily N-acetyltransferase
LAGAGRMPLRSATTEDIAGMHVVRVSVRENRLSDPARVTHEDYRLMLEEKGCGWVYESGGEIVGFGIVDLSERNIWALFVAPHCEGKGIGSALLKAMVARGFEAGAEPLWLTTSPGTRAEKLYRKAGWQAAGVTDMGELRFELYSPEHYR